MLEDVTEMFGSFRYIFYFYGKILTGLLPEADCVCACLFILNHAFAHVKFLSDCFHFCNSAETIRGKTLDSAVESYFRAVKT